MILVVISSVLCLAFAGAFVATLIKASKANVELSAARERIAAAENAAVEAQNRARADLEAADRRARADTEAALERQKRLFDDALARQKSEAEAARAEMETNFGRLAARALADNAENLRRQSVNGLQEVLNPVRQNLDEFKRTITERYDKESQERFSLSERVQELMSLNQTIGQETRRLADALRGNTRLQGAWGELILSNILESAGMRKGVDFTVQDTVTDAEGRTLRPDVVINYTEGRKIVVDSKVSITDYIAMLNDENEEARRLHAKAHVRSVSKHVQELQAKHYADIAGPTAYDYVLMFIPHEGAFIAAMNLDPALWQAAYDRKVIIISPVHLLSILKLIEQMWRQEKQNRNALEIAERAGRLLDKFNGFLDDMTKIDESITAAHTAFDNAISKLKSGRGNAMSLANNIVKLGAKTKRPLPERYLPDDSDEASVDDNTV